MLKKTASLILAVILTVFLAVPAFAADTDETLSENQAIAAVEAGIAALVAEEGDDVIVDSDLADKITNDANTPEEISRAIARFVFIEKSRVDELSSAIVEDSKYTVKVIADGKETVYIAVNIIDHPEIYDARVFLSVVEKLVGKADEFAAANGVDINSDNYSPMSYTYLAGELSCHMILLDITDALGGDDWNKPLKEFFEKSRIADLNIDENRVPNSLIIFVGRIITFFFEILFK